MRDISKDILVLASRGDIKAFEEVYKITSGFVYSVAFGITNDIGSAQDVTQEVFVKIHRNLKKFQFRSSFSTWVYRVTVNTAINIYRKTSKQLHLKNKYDKALKHELIFDKKDEVLDREDSKQFLISLLEILNPEQKACVILREVEGLSYKEISKALKIKVNTVRSRLKRARQALMANKIKEAVKYEL